MRLRFPLQQKSKKAYKSTQAAPLSHHFCTSTRYQIVSINSLPAMMVSGLCCRATAKRGFLFSFTNAGEGGVLMTQSFSPQPFDGFLESVASAKYDEFRSLSDSRVESAAAFEEMRTYL